MVVMVLPELLEQGEYGVYLAGASQCADEHRGMPRLFQILQEADTEQPPINHLHTYGKLEGFRQRDGGEPFPKAICLGHIFGR